MTTALERSPRTTLATLRRDPRDLWAEHARKLYDHLVGLYGENVGMAFAGFPLAPADASGVVPPKRARRGSVKANGQTNSTRGPRSGSRALAPLRREGAEPGNARAGRSMLREPGQRPDPVTGRGDEGVRLPVARAPLSGSVF
ncbi:hypothetical protein, partial [Streptomyces mirabilis]